MSLRVMKRTSLAPCRQTPAARSAGHLRFAGNRPLTALAVLPVLAGLVAGGAAAAQASEHQPARAAAPALTQTARIPLFTTASIFKNIFAEAPNGTVFFSRGSVVYAVVRNSAPAVAEHAGGQVLALAANRTELFVQTGLTVTAYSRSTGAALRHWALTSPVTPITAAGLLAVGNTVWSWTDWATDQSGFEFAKLSMFSATSATVHAIDSQMYPADWAAGTSGLYYEDVRSPGNTNHLAHVTPGGTLTTKTQPDADAPMALSGGRIDVLSFHNGHQNIDTYSMTTLARLSSAHASNAARAIAGTTAGLVALVQPCAELACLNATVSKLAVTGHASGAVTLPRAFELLAGPQAAVIEVVNRHVFLVRIGA